MIKSCQIYRMLPNSKIIKSVEILKLKDIYIYIYVLHFSSLTLEIFLTNTTVQTYTQSLQQQVIGDSLDIHQ